MRQQAQRARREARMQAQADKLALLPREMAGMGLSEDIICAELDKAKVRCSLAAFLAIAAHPGDYGLGALLFPYTGACWAQVLCRTFRHCSHSSPWWQFGRCTAACLELAPAAALYAAL